MRVLALGGAVYVLVKICAGVRYLTLKLKPKARVLNMARHELRVF